MAPAGRVLAAEAVGTGVLLGASAVGAVAITAEFTGTILPTTVPIWAIAAGAGLVVLLFAVAYAGLRSWAPLHMNPAVTVTRLVGGQIRAGEAVDRLLAQAVGAAVVVVVCWWLLAQQSSLPAASTSTLLTAVGVAVVLFFVPAIARSLVGPRAPKRASAAPSAAPARSASATVNDDAETDLPGPVELVYAAAAVQSAPESGTSVPPADRLPDPVPDPQKVSDSGPPAPMRPDSEREREGFDLMPILLATEPFESGGQQAVDVAPAPETMTTAAREGEETASARRTADLAAFMNMAAERSAPPVAEPVAVVDVEPVVVEPVAVVDVEPVVVEPVAVVDVEPVVVEPALEPEKLLVAAPSLAPEASAPEALVAGVEPEPMTSVSDRATHKHKRKKKKRKDSGSGRDGVNVTVNVYLDGAPRKGKHA